MKARVNHYLGNKPEYSRVKIFKGMLFSVLLFSFGNLFSQQYSVKCEFISTDPDSMKSKDWFNNFSRLKKDLNKQKNRAVTFRVSKVEGRLLVSSYNNTLSYRGIKSKRLSKKGDLWVTALDNSFSEIYGRPSYCYGSNRYTRKYEQSLVEYCFEQSVIESEFEVGKSKIPNLRIHLYPYDDLEDGYATGVSKTDVLTIHYLCNRS